MIVIYLILTTACVDFDKDGYLCTAKNQAKQAFTANP